MGRDGRTASSSDLVEMVASAERGVIPERLSAVERNRPGERRSDRRANTLPELRDWTPFVGLQIEYSLVERTVERELVPMAATLGLTVTARSPLGGGMLSGK